MGMFKEKTAIITGASRGIGRELALMLADEGANVVLAAKTKERHLFLDGTIESVAQEVEALGGRALPYQLDVRDDDKVAHMARDVAGHFGGIDIVINNAGAIYLTGTLETTAKQFDLMNQVNARATFLVSRAAIPFMKNGGHILNLSPPISLDQALLAPHIAYTISKFGMSFCTLAMAAEFASLGIAVNSLWPKTIIYTAAIARLMGESAKDNCRSPKIVADAARWIFSQSPKEVTGNLFDDEEVLKRAGVKDFASYRCGDGVLLPDLYVA